MKTYVNQEKQSRSTAARAKNGQDLPSTSQFLDNRFEAIQMRELQEKANNSQRVRQLKAMQEMANNSPRVKQLTAMQEMANNSPRNKELAQLQQMANKYVAKQELPIQKKENNTGLPGNLNEHARLEEEADIIGKKAFNTKIKNTERNNLIKANSVANLKRRISFPPLLIGPQNVNVVQRVQYLWMLNPTGDSDFDAQVEDAQVERTRKEEEARRHKIVVDGEECIITHIGGHRFKVVRESGEEKALFLAGTIEEIVSHSPFITNTVSLGSFYTVSKPHLYFSIKSLSSGGNQANEMAEWNEAYKGFQKSTGHKRGFPSPKSETFVVDEHERVIINSENVGHEVIAGERPVYMAGTMMHHKGALMEWYNNSGHYLPVGDGALSISVLKIPGTAWH